MQNSNKRKGYPFIRSGDINKSAGSKRINESYRPFHAAIETGRTRLLITATILGFTFIAVGAKVVDLATLQDSQKTAKKQFYEAKLNNSPKVLCWGSGSPMREFMHVDDLAKAVIFALKSWNPNSSKAPKTNEGKSLFYLNVGTGKDISIKDLAEKIANILDFKGKITWDPTKPNGTPKKLLDISRLSKLGWNSQITLNDGIIKTLETIGQELNLNE